METTVLFALFVSLSHCAVLSFPVESSSSQGLKSVNKSNATFDASVKRNKRQVLEGNGSCAKGQKWLANNKICVSIEKYNESVADDYEEITTDSQDEDTTPHPIRLTTQATTMPHPEPVSGPDETPPPQRRSTLGSTKLPRNTPHPNPTSPSPPTTPRPVPLQGNRAGQTSSPHTMTTTIVFVLCVFLFHRAV